MINFRYHLVSLTAVFLALTVGLILGTAALNGPAIDALEATSQSLRDSNAAYRDEIAALEEELNDDQSFASEIAPPTSTAGWSTRASCWSPCPASRASRPTP
ncbi:hypothetical protein GCM10029992_51840 [Glycomyces albus]